MAEEIERGELDFKAFESYKLTMQEVKEQCLLRVAAMIKSKSSTDAIREAYPFFEIADIEMLIEYIGNPMCSIEDLKVKLRDLNGFGLIKIRYNK